MTERLKWLPDTDPYEDDKLGFVLLALFHLSLLEWLQRLKPV
jgi:hypothetical protein